MYVKPSLPTPANKNPFDYYCAPCNGTSTVNRAKRHSLNMKNVEQISCLRSYGWGTSLVVQWLRLCAPNAGGPGLIPGQGTISHIPQLRVRMLQLKKIPHAAIKTWSSQIKKKILWLGGKIILV